MGVQSYDYGRRAGVLEIGWEQFATLCRELAEALAAQQIDSVVGIARAGLFPATAVACMLRMELVPVRVSRRSRDRVVHKHPVWHVDVPRSEVEGRIVAVVDEIADSGETLALVAARVRERGARQVITASLVAHSWAQPLPDVTALLSDALVLFPWDGRVLEEGRWRTHPELEEALRLQQSKPPP